MDIVEANQEILDYLMAEEDGPPAGVDEGKYLAAKKYSLGRYKVGLRHYVDVVRHIGFCGGQRVIDIGSGAGHWCVAFVTQNESVEGVELRPEYVEIARQVVLKLNLHDKIRFRVGRAEVLKYPENYFDYACCHGVLMFANHELAVRESARVVKEGGELYCGYTTVGNRIRGILRGAIDDNLDKLSPQLRILMSDFLYRCGVYSTPRSRVRVFSINELLKLMIVFGFQYVEEPDVQDGLRKCLDYPATFDIVVRKNNAHTDYKEKLLERTDRDKVWLRSLVELIECGCPNTVIEVLKEGNVRLGTSDLREVYARAVIKAGLLKEEALTEAFFETGAWSDNLPFIKGLYWHERRKYQEALRSYQEMLDTHRDKTFLIGACLLELGELEQAQKVFSQLVEQDKEDLRGWIGYLASLMPSRKANVIKETLIRFVEHRKLQGAETDECDKVIDDLRSEITSQKQGGCGEVSQNISQKDVGRRDGQEQLDTKSYTSAYHTMEGASLRKFPYPYKAMLSISNDVDLTTIEVFRETHRFMNTLVETSMGPGVGLDISNSFWVYKHPPWGMPKFKSEIAYFADWSGEKRTEYSEELITYIKAGWIDTLHSYGNFTRSKKFGTRFTRRHAIDALKLLENKGIYFEVWVNHGDSDNIQNIGRSSYMQGDISDSPAYHADILKDYGILFIWNHNDNHIFGTDSAISSLQLRDGTRFWGFPRYYRGVDLPKATELAERFDAKSGTDQDGNSWVFLWEPQLLHLQLSDEKLTDVIKRQLYCILAQHLGKLSSQKKFGHSTIEAFRRLRDHQNRGDILVTRISRLLKYNKTHEYISYETRREEGTLLIDITNVKDPVIGILEPVVEDLRGITFYTEDPGGTRILINGVPIPEKEVSRWPSDGTAPSIGVNWYSPDFTDYTQEFECKHSKTCSV